MLSLCLFITRITQSLVKDLHENIYQNGRTWASLEMINNWSQVETLIQDFFFKTIVRWGKILKFANTYQT